MIHQHESHWEKQDEKCSDTSQQENLVNVVESPIESGPVQRYDCDVKVQGQPELIEWNDKNDDYFKNGAKEENPAPNRRHNKFDSAVVRCDLNGIMIFDHQFAVNETILGESLKS